MEHIKLTKVISNIDTWRIKQEKGKLQHEIKDSKQTLEQIIKDKQMFSGKTQLREDEIRAHIENLDYLNSTNIEKTKGEIQVLYDEVSQNITMIEQKMKFEIDDTKKDIQNRINIRLMDSEYTHRTLLEKKIKQQESFMKVLHSFTAQIVSIQENYKKSKSQVLELLNENNDLKEKILKVKLAKKKLLQELQIIKEVLSDISKEIYYCYENKKVLGNINDINNKLKNSNKYHLPKKFAYGNNLYNENIKNDSVHMNNTINNFSKILNKFKQENNKLKRISSAISSSKEGKLNDILYSIVFDIKDKSFKKNKSMETVSNIVFFDKDKRRKFIEMITNNRDIIDIINNCSLPTIAYADRKIQIINS